MVNDFQQFQSFQKWPDIERPSGGREGMGEVPWGWPRQAVRVKPAEMGLIRVRSGVDQYSYHHHSSVWSHAERGNTHTHTQSH